MIQGLGVNSFQPTKKRQRKSQAWYFAQRQRQGCPRAQPLTRYKHRESLKQPQGCPQAQKQPQGCPQAQSRSSRLQDTETFAAAKSPVHHDERKRISMLFFFAYTPTAAFQSARISVPTQCFVPPPSVSSPLLRNSEADGPGETNRAHCAGRWLEGQLETCMTEAISRTS